MQQALNVSDFRRISRRRLPRMVFDFIDGGAEEEQTLRANRRAFFEVDILPKVLVDVAERELSTELFGERLDLPILLAPTGLSRLAGGGGDIAAAQAAARAGTKAILSSASSDSIEEVAAAAGPQWFQLYPWGDRAITRNLIDRAEGAGFRTLVVTVDVPTVGGRERDVRRGLTVPPQVNPRTMWDVGRHPRWWWRVLTGPQITFQNFLDVPGVPKDGGTVGLAKWSATLNDPSYTWADLAWVRDRWKGSMVIKGILRPEDAVKAAELGCDGIVVSNHGGRQLDGAPASLRVLPEIRDAAGDRLEILLDGGVRRGTDVLKALALGAKAVLIGRPWLWAMAAGGDKGLDMLFSVLRNELDRALVLAGCARAAELDEQHVRLTVPRGCP